MQRTAYGEPDVRATRLAHGLRRRGLQHGDRLAYLGHNSVDLVDGMIATAKLGAVFVPSTPGWLRPN